MSFRSIFFQGSTGVITRGVLPNNNNHRFDTPLNELQSGSNGTKLAATYFSGQMQYIYQNSSDSASGDSQMIWWSSVGRTGVVPSNAIAVQAVYNEDLTPWDS
jgi:hypothetical protein